MKKTLFYALCGVMAAGLMTACNTGTQPDEMSKKEKALQAVMTPYVNDVVVPAYKGMADYAIEMSDYCNQMLEEFDNGGVKAETVKAACEAWNKSRDYWEKSEAFLYGPAGNHNIDPHIDSWPLDLRSMVAMLNNEAQMKEIEDMGADYILNNLGYGLLGYHAVEYNLFELTDNGNASQPHSVGTYTRPQLVYLDAVAQDLAVQTTALEACWAGLDNVTKQKADLLEEAEVEYSEMGDGYGWQMINAGKGGSSYKTYQEAAEEIVAGAIDIVTEVGNLKIGNPNRGIKGEAEGDREYIESPYSLNSVNDFVGNITSVYNAYTNKDGNASISTFVKGQNPDLDAKVRKAIDEAIAAIKAIPEPFAKTAGGAEADAAIAKLAELETILNDEVLKELASVE